MVKLECTYTKIQLIFGKGVAEELKASVGKSSVLLAATKRRRQGEAARRLRMSCYEEELGEGISKELSTLFNDNFAKRSEIFAHCRNLIEEKTLE